MKSEKLRIKNNKAFTLVELLIVIALIGILAAALVATLNPVEQINKARDSKFKNDAAELLAAIERYYASTQNYPWVVAGVSVCGDGTALCTNNLAFGATADDAGVGICAAGVCTDAGVLISSSELKGSFAKKEIFTTTLATDRLYIRKTSTGGSLYVCFIPKSGTNREAAVLTSICSAGDADCTTFKDPVDVCPDPGSTGWDNANSACYICVPEVGTVGVGS